MSGIRFIPQKLIGFYLLTGHKLGKLIPSFKVFIDINEGSIFTISLPYWKKALLDNNLRRIIIETQHPNHSRRM